MSPQVNPSNEAVDFQQKNLVIDGLQAAPMTPEHFERLKIAGVDAVNYTSVKITDDFSSAVLNLWLLLKTIEGNPEDVLLVLNASDIERARKEGKIGIIAGFQNASPIMDRLEYLEIFHKLGVRVIQLTYNERNLLGDGCVEIADGGLSRFGIKVVKEMNRLGILVDLSHCGQQTTLDAIEVSNSPVFISHANAKALCPSLRNKSDTVLRALKENRGVIGVAFWGPMAYKDPNIRPTIPDLLDHVDYLVEQVGVDHVTIGSDLGEGESREAYEAMFIGGGGLYPEITEGLGDWYVFDNRMVEHLDTIVNLPLVTQGLMERGYPRDAIKKILGGNLLRLFREVAG